jgi:hypothetical protein
MSLFSSVGNKLKQGFASAETKDNHFGILSDVGQFAKGVVSGGTDPSHFKNTGYPGVTLDQIHYNPVPIVNNAPMGNGFAGGGNAGGGNGGGGAAGGGYAPGIDLTPYRNNIYGDQNQINSLYDQVNGQIGAYGSDRRNQIDANYATQFANNDKAFAGANNGTIGAYQGHGLSDSSLMGNALDQNKSQYQTSNSDLLRSRDQNYADLGSTLNNARQQLGDKPQFDLSKYQDADSLTTLHNQLGQYIQSLKGSQNSLLTQGQLKGKLDAIAPAQSNLQGQLKDTLDKLVAGNADPSLTTGYCSNLYLTITKGSARSMDAVLL